MRRLQWERHYDVHPQRLALPKHSQHEFVPSGVEVGSCLAGYQTGVQ